MTNRFIKLGRLSGAVVLFVIGVTPASPQSSYTFFAINPDFPSFHDDLAGCAVADINDEGLIVGGCSDLADNSQVRGFLHDGRRFREIDFARVRTQTAGRMTLQGRADFLPIARSVYQSEFWTQPGTLRSIRPIVTGVTPQSINSQAHVTGTYFNGTRLRGFLQRNGSASGLTFPGSQLTEATGINDVDQVVGDYLDQAGVFRGFSYQDGIYTTIDFPSATDTGATGVNNLGQIVGCYSLCSRGFLYTPQTSAFTSIDVPGAESTQATDINDLGQVIGVYYDGGQLHGFLYDQDGFTTIDAPGAVVTSLYGINNFGQLTGFYAIEISPGVFESRAFVATP
jgi:probable HAF family extracellular repeat protein